MNMGMKKVAMLVDVLLDEVEILRELVSGLQQNVEEKERLLAEKAAIIDGLSKMRNKVTPNKPKATKRKVGRPKGSKSKTKQA